MTSVSVWLSNSKPLALQFGAQLFVVFDDAVVYQRDPSRRVGCCVRPGREVRVCVGDGRRAVRGPARVRDAGAGLDVLGRDLGLEFGHPRRAACAPQLAALVHCHTARVVAAVLEPLQAFDEDRNDVARADRADDATHG